MKKKITLDIVFYLITPFFIWNYFRQGYGDYHAMLLTTLPGTVYTIYFFFKDKTYSITGLYMLFSLFLGRTMDIISNSAEGMLWNDIYLDIFYALFWSISIAIKKPMGMYMFIDYAYMRGYRRKDSERLYRRKELFKYFQYFSALFVLKSIERLLVKLWCIKTYGVDGFINISIIMKVNGWVLSGITAASVFLIIDKIKKVTRFDNVINVNSKELLSMKP